MVKFSIRKKTACLKQGWHPNWKEGPGMPTDVISALYIVDLFGDDVLEVVPPATPISQNFLAKQHLLMLHSKTAHKNPQGMESMICYPGLWFFV